MNPISHTTTHQLDLRNEEGLQFLESVPSDSVDLILTDPPYITSRKTGMDEWVKHIEKQDSEGAENVMTEEDWDNLKTEEEWEIWFESAKKKSEPEAEPETDEQKEERKLAEAKRRTRALKKMKKDFLKYGSIYGKKYAVRTDYGSWDSEFTLEQLDLFIKHFYRILKPGGTCIIFFDLWKITNLKDMLESEKFKQIRFIEWIKTNPQPINSKVNYLTNCREIALLGIKKSKPTFNSKYDNGIYDYLYKHPLQGGKFRFHPTQKSLRLFEDLIKKHSNEGDLVLDCFSGSGTTAVAARNTNRNFIGCEMNEEYYEKSLRRLQDEPQTTKSNEKEQRG